MKRLVFLLSAALLCCACGEDPAPPTPAAAEPAPPRDELLRALFEAQGAEELRESIDAARRGGVGEQAILEARFVARVDAGDDAGIAALVPELEAAAPNFDAGGSAIFTQREEFLAVLEYARALAALESGDRDGFKAHIKEAFWLSPNQGAAFAPHIERLRLEEAMARLKLDFQRPLTAQQSGKRTTLAESTGGADVTLLHFWSPWSEECTLFLDDFIATSRELSEHGVAVVSLLAEPAPEALADAREFATTAAGQARSAWLLDHPTEPLARDLRVMNVPTFVVVHKDGRILFNGHPAEDSLWTRLKEAVPAVERPAVPAAETAPGNTPSP